MFADGSRTILIQQVRKCPLGRPLTRAPEEGTLQSLRSRSSRTKARESIRWSHLKALLEDRGVQLLSAGLDESPHAYKDIEEVMDAQAALVRRVARFMPRIVKMAPEGERPED